MNKCEVLFLVGLTVAISGCCSPDDPTCDRRYITGIGDKCIEYLKRSAVPCINNNDITNRLKQIHIEIATERRLSCSDYQRLYCREMLNGLKK